MNDVHLLLLLLCFCLMPLPAAAQAPLTSLEALQYENLVLKKQLSEALGQAAALRADVGQCFAALGPLEADRNRTALSVEIARLKTAIEADRPGWTFNPETKTFAPAPPPAASTPPKPEGE